MLLAYRVTARLNAGVKQVYRVAFSAGLALSLAACAAGSGSISSGFNDGPPPSSIKQRQKPDTSLGGDTSVPRGSLTGSQNVNTSAPAKAQGTQVASLGTDKAPKGTFEKAPPGSLTDRDYSGTALDPTFARDIINQYRVEHGLKPLKLNTELTAAAKAHSKDLAKWDRISHYGSDGSNPWDRVKRAGFKARLAAENVGTGQIDFSEVMKGWKDSPGHNKNLLLSDAESMGIALVHEPKTEYKSFWTLVIGTPM